MPETLPVRSENQWFQKVDVIHRNRAKRHRHGMFLVEGVRSIDQLVTHPNWEIEAFLYTPGRSQSDWARGILASSRARWHLELAEPLMTKLSDREETSELLALVKMPPDELEQIPVQEDALVVVLDQPARPGNIGSIVRSCDALRGSGCVIYGHAADLYDPKSVRSAAGSLFALPAARIETHQDLDRWLAALRQRLPRFQLIGTSATGERLPEELDLTLPTALFIGNETRGLSKSLRSRVDGMSRIPMAGSASSLNVASATTVYLNEARRQRST